MKKSVLIFFLHIAVISPSLAQYLPNLKHIKLNKKVHYKDAEPVVVKTIAYLFATPIDRKNKARTTAGQFLINWMNGTPDYTFHLPEKETNYFNTDADLMLMYMAGLTKFTLENKSVKEQKLIVLGSMKLVLDYLNHQENKKSWNTDLWQLNEANQKGKLEAFLYP